MKRFLAIALILFAGCATSRKLDAPVVLTGYAGADLLRLQTADSLRDARALAARWERAGAALPLAALSVVTPLTLHLLSPARRPVQVTSDLAGFWERLYPQVRKELARRYPKHKWPEKPV